MKSTNWVINGVLAVAIIVLYVLHFSGSASPSKQAAMQSAGGTKVAYFEIQEQFVITNRRLVYHGPHRNMPTTPCPKALKSF